MAALTFYPRNVVSRRTQLAVAHQLAAQLGLETRVGHDRSHYEARLVELIGRRSLKGATREQRQVVIRAFEAELEAAAAQRRTVYAASDDEALSVLA